MKTTYGAIGPPEGSFSREPPAIATDGKRRVVFLNPAAARLLGVRHKDVLGSELGSVLSREAMNMLARSAVLRIPGAVPRAERMVYILDPTILDCPLSRREHEIVTLLTDGYAALNIAARLNLSHATVRNHIQNALRKLEVHSQVEIVALALRRGWVDRQEPRWNAASPSRHRSVVERMAADV
jgi:DNA-binding CsgD family transcriptional regulator